MWRIERKSFQAVEIASAKALRQGRAWYVWGTERRQVWLKGSEEVESGLRWDYKGKQKPDHSHGVQTGAKIRNMNFILTAMWSHWRILSRGVTWSHLSFCREWSVVQEWRKGNELKGHCGHPGEKWWQLRLDWRWRKVDRVEMCFGHRINKTWWQIDCGMWGKERIRGWLLSFWLERLGKVETLFTEVTEGRRWTTLKEQRPCPPLNAHRTLLSISFTWHLPAFCCYFTGSAIYLPRRFSPLW